VIDGQVILPRRQVSIQVIVPIIGHVNVKSQTPITLASPVTVPGSVGLVPDTTVVAQQIPGFSGSPWVVTGTVAVVPGIAGQLVMSASQPVVIASDQSAVTVRQLAVSSPWVVTASQLTSPWVVTALIPNTIGDPTTVQALNQGASVVVAGQGT